MGLARRDVRRGRWRLVGSAMVDCVSGFGREIEMDNDYYDYEVTFFYL